MPSYVSEPHSEPHNIQNGYILNYIEISFQTVYEQYISRIGTLTEYIMFFFFRNIVYSDGKFRFTIHFYRISFWEMEQNNILYGTDLLLLIFVEN